MKQVFTKKHHDKFIKYFNIEENPGKYENIYIKKTEKYIKYIKWIPGIKMIGIGNSISMNSANKESDIDLYIVTETNRMWLVRIFVTFIFQILGVRKSNKKHAGRFCLSFFSTLNGMDFGKFKIKNDIYLYFWIIYFKPILDYDNTYNLFIEKNCNWADFSEYKNILEENRRFIKYKKDSSSIKKKEKILYAFLNGIEKLFEKIFLPKTKKHFEKIGKPFGVIINDDLLKFHNGDIREKIKEELI